MDEFLKWVAVVGPLISLGTLIYVWLTSGAKKAQTDVDALKKSTTERFEKMEAEKDERWERLERENRIASEATLARFSLIEMSMAKIDEALKHIPDREQSHRLELAITQLSGRLDAMDQRVSGKIETLDERLKPVSAISDRLQEFLLEQAAQQARQ